MMIALPNLDRSFTCTLFLPHTECARVRSVYNATTTRHFFTQTFPDAVPLIAELEDEFFRNPTGGLVTVRCAPWYHGGQALLLGDAAHAIVPFFGQGMNCAFEDCEVLLDLFDEYGGDWAALFPRFFEERKPNADAIAQLALDNFIEMRDTSADPHFGAEAATRTPAGGEVPPVGSSRSTRWCRSTASRTAKFIAGRVQDRVLMAACARATSLAEIDADAAFAQLQTALAAE